MRNFCLIMALLVGLEARGQHFSPFRPGALAQYSAAAGDTVRLLQLLRRGEAGVLGMDSLYLFAGRAGASPTLTGPMAFGRCWPRDEGGPFGQALDITHPGTMQAEYYLLGGYSPRMHYYELDLLLKPRAPLNQVWAASWWGTTARVVSRAVEPVLGVPDSVVTIALSGGQQVKLSKFHGLVESPVLAYVATSGVPRRQVLTALPGTGTGQPLTGALAVYDFQPGDRFVYRYDENAFLGNPNPTPPPSISYYFADSILSRVASRTGDTLTYRVLTCSQQGNRVSTVATVRYTAASGPGTRPTQRYLRGVSPLASFTNLFSGTMLYDAARGPYPTNRPVQRAAYLPLCLDTLAYAGPTIDRYAGASYAAGLGRVSNYVADHFGTSSSTTLVGYRKGSEAWGQLPRLLCSPLAATTSSRPAATVAAFPNPFEAELSVTFVLGVPQTVALTLHDALGRVVLKKPAAPLTAGSRQLWLATAGLPAGLYALHLSFAGSSRIEVLKVLKTR